MDKKEGNNHKKFDGKKTKFIRTPIGKFLFYALSIILIFIIYSVVFVGGDWFNGCYLAFISFILAGITLIPTNTRDMILEAIVIFVIIWILRRIYALFY